MQRWPYLSKGEALTVISFNRGALEDGWKMANLAWILTVMTLLGAQSTDAYRCKCELGGCVLTDADTVFFNNVNNFCSTSLRSEAHDICISHLQDTQLPPNALGNFPNMTKLTIIKGQLEHFSPDTFSSGGKLTSLTMQQNKLTSLEDFTFKGAENLRYLQILFNPLTTVAENAFANLKHLENLHLAFGEIMTLPKRVFQNNRRLKNIMLHNNKLTSIDPEVLDGLDELTFFDVAHNHLKTFHFKFLKATAVVLTNNILEHLVVNERCGVTHANYNKIKSLDVDGATSLTKLSVMNNEISDISNITKLVNLKSLSLGANNLNPSTVFSSLASLEELKLQSTYINLTEDTFNGLSKLRILILSYNNHTEADFNIFKSQISLQVLSYIGNRIKVFNYIEAKEYLPRLRFYGWNATYFATYFASTYFASNIFRMRTLSLIPDVHMHLEQSLPDFINRCIDQTIVRTYDYYGDYLEDLDDIEEETDALYAEESATTSTTSTITKTTITTTPPPSPSTTTTTTTTPATSSRSTTTPDSKDHQQHGSEYNNAANVTYTQTDPIPDATSTFQVLLVCILSVLRVVSLVVGVVYLWKKRRQQPDSRRNGGSSAEFLRLI